MRVLLQILLPLAAPIVIYAFWSAYTRRRAGLTGVANWEEGNWFWAIVTGFALVVVVTIVVMNTASGPDSVYEPARLENGKVVPGRLRPPDEPRPEN